MDVSEKDKKTLDIFFLIFLPVAALSIVLSIHANYLTSIFVFFLPPALYLSYRTPKAILRSLVFTFIFSLPFGFFSDYIGILGGAWVIPATVFPLRLLNTVVIEDLSCFVLYVYTVVIFYEHFLDKGKHKIVDTHIKYLVFIFMIMFLLFFATSLFNPSALRIPYVYFWGGLLGFLLPIISFLSFFPRHLSKYIKIGVYFFAFLFLFEIAGLQLNHWQFTGKQFIGWVEFLDYRFPLEELLYWILLSATMVLSYFEFFDEDRAKLKR